MAVVIELEDQGSGENRAPINPSITPIQECRTAFSTLGIDCRQPENAKDCFCACTICDLRGPFLLIAAGILFICGRVFGKESAVQHFTGDESHQRKSRLALVLAILLMLVLFYLGLLSNAYIVIGCLVFMAGYMFSRSKHNYNQEMKSYDIQYNRF
jgi:type III secretory pathway component EscV